MRPLFALVLLLLLPTLATAQNWIGLYVTDSPQDMEDATISECSGVLGPLYLVIEEPWNEVLSRPITYLGGYELTLNFPGAWSIFGEVTLPPNTANFSSAGYPEFWIAGTFPTSGGRFTTLASFQIANFAEQPGWISIGPTSYPSNSGEIAVTDADDDFSLQQAFPVTEDFRVPVFGICMELDSQNVSWSGVKSLYR